MPASLHPQTVIASSGCPRVLWRLIAAWIAVFALVGCGGASLENSLDLANLPTNGIPVDGIGLPKGFAGEPEQSLQEVAEAGAVGGEQYLPPFPDRKNPFEFGAEYAGDGFSNEISTDASNIRLFGFAGDSPARAILNAGGRTKMLAEGERWGVIEIMEVRPPQAKIRVDGVVRTWSLLGDAGQPAQQ